jgi:hypothetical protein
MKRYAGARAETQRPKHSRAIFTQIPKSVETEVVRNTQVIETPSDIPWELVWLNAEQANARGLTTLRKIAEVHGLEYHKVGYWSRCDNIAFPKPVAKLHTDGNAGIARLYPAAELVAWVKKHMDIR